MFLIISRKLVENCKNCILLACGLFGKLYTIMANFKCNRKLLKGFSGEHDLL